MKNPDVISNWTDYLSIVESQIQDETVIELVFNDGSVGELRRARNEDFEAIGMPLRHAAVYDGALVLTQEGNQLKIGNLEGPIIINRPVHIRLVLLMRSASSIKSIRAKELKQDQNFQDAIEVLNNHFADLDIKVDWIKYIRDGVKEKLKTTLQRRGIYHDVIHDDYIMAVAPIGEEISALNLNLVSEDIERKVSAASMQLLGQIEHGVQINITIEEFIKVTSIFSKFIEDRCVDVGGSLRRLDNRKVAKLTDGELKVEIKAAHLINNKLAVFKVNVVD